MPRATTADLLDVLRRLALLDADRLDTLSRESLVNPQTLARSLRERGWLTAYQIERLLHEREDELRLGPYVLLDKLGEGGMGQVFKARDAAGSIVALKVIRRDRLDSPDMERRFRREIAAAMRLKHPNVVAAHAQYEGDGLLALAMELLDGIDLAHRVVQRGPLPPAEAADLVRQAALGLQHAHDNGLVHRDVKPANLLLATDGTVKVLDLGLARREALSEADVSTTLTRAGIVMGTPDFMAPEQIEDCHGVDGRADVYALGCTLYFLLTGRLPFPGGSLAKKLTRHLSDVPAPLETLRPDVPANLAGVVRKMMAKRPEQRYGSAAAAAEALANWPFQAPPSVSALVAAPLGVPVSVIGSSPFEGIEQPATDVPPAPRRRHHLERWVALVLLVGAAVLFAVWLRSRPGPTPSIPEEEPAVAKWTLDQLDAAAILPEERFAEHPPELVAVLGSSRLRCPGDPPYGRVVVSRDGKYVAAVRPFGTLCLWEAETGREIARLPQVLGGPFVSDLAFVPDPDRPSLAVCGDQGKLVLVPYDADGFKGRITPAQASAGVYPGLAVAPEGKSLACTGAKGTVFVWDLTRPNSPATVLGGAGTELYYAVAYSSTGWLAAGGDEKTVRLWRKEGLAWKDAGTLESGLLIRSLVFAPDGHTLAVGGEGQVKVWSVDELTRPPDSLTVSAKVTVNYLAYTTAGTALLATGPGGSGVHLWTRSRPGGAFDKQDQELPMSGIAATIWPAGQAIATLGLDGIVRLWDRKDQTWSERWPRRDHGHQVNALAFTPDGRYLFTGATVGPILQWNLSQPTRPVALPSSEYTNNAYYALQCPPGTRQLLAGSNLRLQRWDLTDANRPFPVGVPPTGAFHALAYDPHRDVVAAANSGAVEIWSLRPPYSKQDTLPLPERKDADVEMVTLSADGRRLASYIPNDVIRLWTRTEKGDWVEKKFLPRTAGRPHGLALVQGGQSLAVLTAEGVLQRWDLDDQAEKAAWGEIAHPKGSTLAYTAETRLVATAGVGGSVAWRSTDDWNHKRLVKLPFAVSSLAFALDGRHLACGCRNGMVYILRLAPPESR